MKITLLLALVLGILARPFLKRSSITAVNIAGTHMDGAITRKAEEELPLRHLLVISGTDPASQVALCGATDEPIGIADDACAPEGLVNVQHAGSSSKTRLAVASVAFAAGVRVYTDAGGKITDVPVSGSFLVGRALTVSDADNDEVEIDPCFPVEQA